MCLSQCINHFCPDPKPSHHRPRGLVRSARSPPSNSPALALSLPLSRSLYLSSLSALSIRFPLALLSDQNARVYVRACVRADARAGVRIVEEDRMSGRTATEMRVTGIGLPVSHPPTVPSPPPFPLDSSSSPSARHGNAGLRAFLMLNVAFCLCGCMGDSGERRSPGQRFFQMLNARFVPTHTVCPCYVVSTGLPGTSQRTRQLRGLVTGVTRLGGRRNGEHLDIVECQASCTASTRTGEHPSPFPHPATQFHESLTSILIITNYSLITKQEG